MLCSALQTMCAERHGEDNCHPLLGHRGEGRRDWNGYTTEAYSSLNLAQNVVAWVFTLWTIVLSSW